MKQKIKFLIASIMILFLSSCEKDLYEDSINNNSKKHIIQTINLNTYNKKPSDLLTFKNKLDNKKRISFESKIVYDSINNFYIDDENVRLIQSDNLESYTIGIKYENSDKIHNIVFDQNEEGDFDSYLVKYDFTSEELNTLSTDVLETKEIIYIPIEFDENGIMRFENPYGGLVCIQEWSTEYNMWANVSGGGNNPSQTTTVLTGNFCQYISTDLSGGGSAPVETNNTGGNNSGYSGGGYNTGNNSNLNTTGGVYGNGGIDGTGIITSPVVVNHILLDFIRNLTPTQLLWWNNPINDDAVDSISNYLLDVEVDEEFVLELINNSIISGLNLDFEKSLKSPTNVDVTAIDITTTVGKKFDCVYKKLMQSPSFKNLFDNTFGGNQTKLNVKFEIVESFTNPNTLGNCQLTTISNNGIPQQYNNLIKIKREILDDTNGIGNASNIKIAKVIIHELMHAYLNIKYKNCNQGASLPYINNLEIGELIQLFYDNFNCHIDVNGSPQSQHDFMYNFLIPSFQSILAECRDLLISQSHINYANGLTFENSSLNINENWNWDKFFKYITLNGLHNCDSFTETTTNNPIENYFYQNYSLYENQVTKNCL